MLRVWRNSSCPSMRYWLVGATFIGACGSDTKVAVYREPPAVTIIQPAAGSTFSTYETIAFVALAETFDDTPVTELQHQWVAGEEIACEWAAVPTDGKANCGIAFENVGEQSITVTVQDTRLDVSTASIQIWTIENLPPTIEIVTPENGSFHSPGSEIVFEASIRDGEDNAADLRVTGVSTEDGPLSFSSSTSTSSGEWTGAIDSLGSGEHAITLTVTDTDGQTDSDNVTLNINGRPGAPVIRLTPNPAVSGVQLNTSIVTDAIDAEGDPITYDYSWERNGEPYPAATGHVVAPGVTIRDETWRVTVTPSDPYGAGEPASADTMIVNSAPTVDSVNLLPAAPTTADIITAYPSGWADQDGDEETYQFEWSINGDVDVTSSTDELPATSTQKGDVIVVTLTPIDSLESGDSVESAPVTVVNSPPDGHTVIISPGSPEPGQDLICSVETPAVDIDGDEIDYIFEWAVDGALLSDPAFSTSVLDGSETSNAETWECIVTATDADEDGGSVSASVYVSDGTAPDPPILDEPSPHRNEASVDINGDCESGCTLTFTCEDDTTSWSFTDSCTVDGSFGVSTSLTVGEITSCWAFCTDPSGNVSGPSNEISTEVCSPGDVYEAGSYGDSAADPIDEWPAIAEISADPSGGFTIVANILEDDDADWFIVTGADDLSVDLADGLDLFRFGVELIDGTDAYSFIVYRDTPYPDGDDECSIDPDGYTQYEWYNEDRGDALEHGLPTPLNACGDSSIFLNQCTDDTTNFYIHMFRNEGAEITCDPYEIEITNGEGW